MKGEVGTAMMAPGEKSRFLSKENLVYLIKANQILKNKAKILKSAVLTELDLSFIEQVAAYPLGMNMGKRRAVYAMWLTVAEKGLLRGTLKIK